MNFQLPAFRFTRSPSGAPRGFRGFEVRRDLPGFIDLHPFVLRRIGFSSSFLSFFIPHLRRGAAGTLYLTLFTDVDDSALRVFQFL